MCLWNSPPWAQPVVADIHYTTVSSEENSMCWWSQELWCCVSVILILAGIIQLYKETNMECISLKYLCVPFSSSFLPPYLLPSLCLYDPLHNNTHTHTHLLNNFLSFLLSFSFFLSLFLSPSHLIQSESKGFSLDLSHLITMVAFVYFISVSLLKFSLILCLSRTHSSQHTQLLFVGACFFPKFIL